MKVFYEEIVKFLKVGTYPEPDGVSSAKRWNFRRKVSRYFLGEDNTLYKKVDINGSTIDLEVPLETERDDIIKKHHDQVGHPGINATVDSIQQQYTWKGLYTHIIDYVASCKICQMTATIPKSTKKLQPIQPPSRTWKHLGMDLICDLPVSSEGFKHILVTVCYLSKFVVVRPLKRKTSEEVIQNLQDIYATMGLPDIIQHDKGPEFTSSLFQEFHCKLHIDNRSTRAYHPMANGLVEAHNKILKTKLTKMEVQTGNHWSQLLKLACLTMNSTKKKSHGQTPFNVKWGRE